MTTLYWYLFLDHKYEVGYGQNLKQFSQINVILFYFRK